MQLKLASNCATIKTMSAAKTSPIEAESLYRVCVDRAGVALSLEDRNGYAIWVQDTDDVSELVQEILECMAESLHTPFLVDSSLQVVDRSRLVFELIRVDQNLVLLDNQGEPIIWVHQDSLTYLSLPAQSEKRPVDVPVSSLLGALSSKITEYREAA